MKKFNATSLNTFLTRVPERDFTDDGTKFKVYEYKNLRATYTFYKDTVYLSFNPKENIDWAFLVNYPEFRKGLRDFNGVPANAVDIDKIKQIVKKLNTMLENEILPAWHKHYRETMTKENIERTVDWIKANNTGRFQLFAKILSSFKPEVFLKLSSYEFSRIKDYYGTVKNRAKARENTKDPSYSDVTTAIKCNFQVGDFEKDFYISSLREILNKAWQN